VREAYLASLSGEVDPVPESKHRASSVSGSSGLMLMQSLKTVKVEHQEKPSEWRVSVRTVSDEDSYDDRRKEIDTSTLSQEDLRSLQKSDPFLYYSIPSIRRSSYLFGNGDNDDISSHDNEDSTFPKQAEQEQTKRRKSIVRRTSRISTEAHPGLIYDDILSELPSLDVEGMDDLIN
jgi:hypothetical protein